MMGELTRRTLHFVPATPRDVAALRELAHDSEAFWGGSAAFMDTFDKDFNIGLPFIEANPVYVAWEQDKAAAFWGLTEDGGAWELEYFYVARSALRGGYGRQMWAHMTDWCRSQGIAEIHFVTSPQAVGFYERMGAVCDCMTASTIDRRPIPHFVCKIR